LAALTNVDDASWPLIQEWLADSTLDSRMVAASAEIRDAALTALQVTVRSTLGGLVWNCGAILIDHGWIKLLGAGAGDLPAAHVADFASETGRFTGVICAYDALGGCFVIHGEGFEADAREVLYWAPDSLRWERLGVGHSALVNFLLSDRVDLFYKDLRWDGWEETAEELTAAQGISAYPPPFAAEGKPGAVVSRAVVPLAEVVESGFRFAEQLKEHPNGTTFRVHVTGQETEPDVETNRPKPKRIWPL